MKNLKRIVSLLLALCSLLALSACTQTAEKEFDANDYFIKSFDLTLSDAEIVALGEAPTSSMPVPTASGTAVKTGGNATIDYSNTTDGYVMIKCNTATTTKMKAIIAGPSGTSYSYTLSKDAQYNVFPLSDGNGKYKITAYKNVSEKSYSAEASVTVDVTLKDEFAPFLVTNQYVNYNENTKCVLKAFDLIGSETDELKIVTSVYDYVVGSFTYDTEKAQSVVSGYLPNLDTVFDAKKGICFDYASTMTAMLRSHGIPTKLVVGYSGKAYHAWINVYSKSSGWINGVIFFDGTSWKLMDPTFASSSKQSASVMKYIGDASNYVAKYLY